MSTDATKFPDGPNLGGKAQRGGEPSSPLKAQIIGVPNEARGAQNHVHIAGEVTRADDQGNVRIKTESGTIELKMAKAKGKAAQALQKGQYVEIDVPPRRAGDSGNEREVQIRVRKNPPATREGRDAAPQERVPDKAAAQQRAEAAAKAPTEVRASDYPQVKLPSAPVRLEPLPPELAGKITIPIPEKIAAKLDSLPLQISEQQARAIQTLLQPAAAQGTAQQAQVPQPVQIASASLPQQTLPLPILQSFTASVTEQPVLTQPSPLSPTPLQTSLQILAPSTGKTAPPLSPATGTAQTPAQSQSFILPAINTKPALSLPQPKGQAVLLTTPSPGPAEKIQGHLAFRNTPATQQAFQPSTLVPERPIGQALLTDIKAPAVQFIPPTIKPEGAEGLIPGSIKNIPNLKAGESRAILSGFTANKLPVISFPSGSSVSGLNFGNAQNFILHTPLPGVPVGAELTLQTSGGLQPQSAGQSAQASAPNYALSYAMPPVPAYFLSPEGWPVMNDIMQTLQSAAPQAAQAMNAMTPSPASSPANLGGAMLFFIAAVKGGDIQSWLGEKAVETLRKAGRGDILSRLGSESQTLSRMAREAPPGEWRGLSIPFMAEQDIQKVAFYYKHDYPDDDGEDNQGEKRTRFIFDLNLSNMGMVQLDGMHKGPRLDMVLRTEEKFSESARMALKQLYIQSLENTSLHGELSFHSHLDQWVKIPLKDEGESLSL